MGKTENKSDGMKMYWDKKAQSGNILSTLNVSVFKTFIWACKLLNETKRKF